jgi:hypothetical protein
VKPLLVATLTDLTAGDQPYPAVKVRREPAKRFPGDALKVGRPVVCVSRYDGASGDRCWSNFHPRPVQCATASEAEVKRLLKEVPASQWEALQAAIRRLPKPLRPGLYRLTDDP